MQIQWVMRIARTPGRGQVSHSSCVSWRIWECISPVLVSFHLQTRGQHFLPPHPVQRAASLEEALSPDMRAGGPQQEGLAGTPGPPEIPHVTGMVVQQVLLSWGPRQPPASLLWILGPYIPVLSLGLDSSQSQNIMLMLKPVLSWLPVIPGLLSQNMAG